MSGIEAAGLVLAVLPLFISAFEDYNEGLEGIKAFWRWEHELPNCIRELRDQHMQYELNLKVLLLPIITDAELAELLNNPIKQLWKNAGIERKLKHELDSAYNTYISRIEDVENIMEDIAGCLDMDLRRQINNAFLENVLEAARKSLEVQPKFQFKKRAKFGWSKKKVKALLKELDKCNGFLKALNENMKMLEPYKKNQGQQSASSLQRLQESAHSLYHELRLSLSSDCHFSHSANLQLEQRIMLKPAASKQKEKSDSIFTVLFPVEPNLCSEASQTWKEAEVSIWEEELEGTICKSTLSKGSPPQIEVSSADAVIIPSSELQTFSALKIIDNTCRLIQQTQYFDSCLGFSLDSSGKLRGVYPVQRENKSTTMIGKPIRLEELLTNPPLVNGLYGLTLKEKYVLAITLASSLLQLYNTPWLSESWSKKDIVFLSEDATSKRPVNIQKPFVTAVFGPSTPTPQSNPPAIDNNASLLGLAVVLLEVSLGQSIKSRHSTENLGLFGTMKYWIAQQEDNLSKAFYSAICHCMSWYADPSKKLGDPSFRQEVLDQVVMPLRDELDIIS